MKIQKMNICHINHKLNAECFNGNFKSYKISSRPSNYWLTRINKSGPLEIQRSDYGIDHKIVIIEGLWDAFGE